MPLIKLFWDICLLKKGPQAAPASPFLLAVTLLAYVLAGIVLLAVGANLGAAIVQTLAEALMLFFFLWLVLYVRKKPERLLQTATATLGCDALISLFAIPLLTALKAFPDIAVIPLLLLILMFWHFAIMAHILRHAMSKPLVFGYALAILYAGVTYQLMGLLFTPAG
jgi:hypothetical protein